MHCSSVSAKKGGQDRTKNALAQKIAASGPLEVRYHGNCIISPVRIASTSTEEARRPTKIKP